MSAYLAWIQAKHGSSHAEAGVQVDESPVHCPMVLLHSLSVRFSCKGLACLAACICLALIIWFFESNDLIG